MIKTWIAFTDKIPINMLTECIASHDRYYVNVLKAYSFLTCDKR